MKLVCCGIPRSGSTLIWQILKTVFPEMEIPQTHPAAWEPDGSFVVSSIRHPCDVAASRYRVRLSRGSEADGGTKGLEAEMVVMKEHYDALHFVRGYRGKLLRYEEFYNDYDVIFKMIRERLWTNVSRETQDEISAKYSVKENKERADKQKSFRTFDEEKIHGAHIGVIHPGMWRLLPDWQRDQIEDFCKPIAAEWGYEV